MKLWIARDENGLLGLHKREPYRHSGLYGTDVFTGGILVCYLPSNEFPEVTWENSPKEIELKLIDNGNNSL